MLTSLIHTGADLHTSQWVNHSRVAMCRWVGVKWKQLSALSESLLKLNQQQIISALCPPVCHYGWLCLYSSSVGNVQDCNGECLYLWVAGSNPPQRMCLSLQVFSVGVCIHHLLTWQHWHISIWPVSDLSRSVITQSEPEHSLQTSSLCVCIRCTPAVFYDWKTKHSPVPLRLWRHTHSQPIMCVCVLLYSLSSLRVYKCSPQWTNLPLTPAERHI